MTKPSVPTKRRRVKPAPTYRPGFQPVAQVEFYWPGYQPEEALGPFSPVPVHKLTYEQCYTGRRIWPANLGELAAWMTEEDLTLILQPQRVGSRSRPRWMGRYRITLGVGRTV